MAGIEGMDSQGIWIIQRAKFSEPPKMAFPLFILHIRMAFLNKEKCLVNQLPALFFGKRLNFGRFWFQKIDEIKELCSK
jgi:hypothetical protein